MASQWKTGELEYRTDLVKKTARQQGQWQLWISLHTPALQP
jgi:hypothetical protein